MYSEGLRAFCFYWKHSTGRALSLPARRRLCPAPSARGGFWRVVAASAASLTSCAVAGRYSFRTELAHRRRATCSRPGPGHRSRSSSWTSSGCVSSACLTCTSTDSQRCGVENLRPSRHDSPGCISLFFLLLIINQHHDAKAAARLGSAFTFKFFTCLRVRGS